MADLRSWQVVSKEFEILVKGVSTGLRIFEQSKGKTRSIFLKRNELVWLAGTVQEVVAEESSEVFWDQSRAGYPRIIAQKCSNRHGRCLTIEEFDGRRRCGTILIPEGRFGQGWVCFISEIRVAKEVISEVGKCRGDRNSTEGGGAARFLSQKEDLGKDGYASFLKSEWQKK
jgi:hypothetical protein